MFFLKQFLKQTVELGVSDIHLEEGAAPAYRLNGEMFFVEDVPPLTLDDMDDIFAEVLTDATYDEFANRGDVDLSYEIPGVSRFRVNALNHYNGRGMVFRIISNEIPTVESLGLPSVLNRIAEYNKGLVLVTGPTGSGKSTTLAAMINHINTTRDAHIITIEDPVEYVHASKRSYVEHRQIGLHAKDFTSALKAALRQSPDVIMVGEMRDLETIRQALRAAETGHLVFGTLHTSSVVQTASRLIDVFPADEQAQIRTLVASVLKAVVNQQLLPGRRGGRVAAMEIMISNLSIASILREARFYQLRTFMMMGRSEGMQTLDYHLSELLSRKLISMDTAAEYATDVESLTRQD